MEKSPKRKAKSNIFFGKYKPIKKIGCGSFGYVFKGLNIIDQKNVAIKVEKKDSNINLLQKESFYLYNLKGIGVPDIISYGYSGKPADVLKKMNFDKEAIKNKVIELLERR